MKEHLSDLGSGWFLLHRPGPGLDDKEGDAVLAETWYEGEDESEQDDTAVEDMACEEAAVVVNEMGAEPSIEEESQALAAAHEEEQQALALMVPVRRTLRGRRVRQAQAPLNRKEAPGSNKRESADLSFRRATRRGTNRSSPREPLEDRNVQSAGVFTP